MILSKFVGKVCTIFTLPINMDYHDGNPENYKQKMMIYFLGVVEEVDSKGILMRQLDGELLRYFVLDNIVGIAQEKVLNPSKEEDAKIIKELKPMQTVPNKGPFVDVAGLAELSKKLSGLNPVSKT
jgi:hypothetical protein